MVTWNSDSCTSKWLFFYNVSHTKTVFTSYWNSLKRIPKYKILWKQSDNERELLEKKHELPRDCNCVNSSEALRKKTRASPIFMGKSLIACLLSGSDSQKWRFLCCTYRWSSAGITLHHWMHPKKQIQAENEDHVERHGLTRHFYKWFLKTVCLLLT